MEGGGGVGDPFINQTAGAEPRRAPLNRKPPGVFERNILQFCVSTPAVYLRATVDESAEESERRAAAFSSTPTNTALTLPVTFRASTSLISRSWGLSASRAAVIACVLEICACGEGRRVNGGEGKAAVSALWNQECGSCCVNGRVGTLAFFVPGALPGPLKRTAPISSKKKRTVTQDNLRSDGGGVGINRD